MADKLLGILGIARKAGKIEIGENNVHNCIRHGKAELIILASDASENSKKKASDAAIFYNVQILTSGYTKGELAAALGSGLCSVCALTDRGFKDTILKLMN